MYFIRFEGETIDEAIENHVNEGVGSIEGAHKDVFIHENRGTKYELIDQGGTSFGFFETTEEGHIRLLVEFP